MPAEKRTTTVRLEEPVLDQLKLACSVLRRSQSDVMNAALMEYFDKYKLSSRYQLHVRGRYLILMKVDSGDFHVLELCELNGVPPVELAEKYRIQLRAPVELILDDKSQGVEGEAR